MKLAKLLTAAVFGVLALGVVSANAAPKGLRDEDVGKKLFNFNVLVHPGEWNVDDNNCPNRGKRVFFQTDGKGGSVGKIYWHLYESQNQSFRIDDCNGTRDGNADITVNQSQDILIFVRLVGPKTSSVDIVCTEVVNDNGEQLCLIDSTTISKGNSFTAITKSLLDGEYDQVLWDLDFSYNAKNLQVWVMEDLSRQ